MGKVAILLVGISIIISCSPEKGLEIEQVQIITKNPEALSKWYGTNLGFEKISKNELSYNNFKIRLKKNEEAFNDSILQESFHLQQVPGLYKIGFITNQFDDLVKKLKKNDVNMVGGIMSHEDLDRRSILVKDPEGNLIQIFDDNGRYKLKPYAIGIIVESIGEQEKWYQVKLPVNKTFNRDLPDKNVFVRLLEGEDFLIELIDTSKEEPVRKELDKYDRLGFNTVTISGASARFEKDHEGNQIINE